MFPKAVTIVFVLFLATAVPALSYLTGRQTRLRDFPRSALYFSAVLSQWVLAAIGLGVIFLTSRSLREIGFRPLPLGAFFRWAFVLTVVALAGSGAFIILERWRFWPQESELVHLLLPETQREKLWAVLLVAPTAALCEEFLFRGYLLAQFGDWLRSAPWGLGASSVVFSLAHAYQGWGGMVRAGLLGALLALAVVRLGSLYPSMAAHFLIDAVALAWLGPRFLRKAADTRI